MVGDRLARAEDEVEYDFDDAVASLDEQFQEIIRSHFWLRMSCREIASELGCNRIQAISKLRMALRRLRSYLEGVR